MLDRQDWITLGWKYEQHKKEETFAADSDREDDKMILLVQICEELWQLRNNQ